MEIRAMLGALIEALSQEITKAGLGGDFCSVTIYPGTAVPVDFGPESGCGGTAWVRLVSANPSVSFPSADTRVNNCAYSLAYTVEMGMVGPAPMMEDRLGNFVLPEDTEQFDASMKLAEELELMHRAIKAAELPQLVLGGWAPQGPDGGVVGGSWTLMIGGDD